MMKVGGMHCGSCEAIVTEALEELKGVEKTEVSRSSATVVYDERVVSPEALKAAIEKEGYTVSG